MALDIDECFEDIIEKNKPSLIKHTLSGVSTNEITEFIRRVDFYIEHFSIISKKSSKNIISNKLCFLLNLETVLNSEFQSRQMPAAVKIEIDD